MKKTFNIEAFKSQINSSLANSTCTPDVREGMRFTLEHVLFETNTYNGYRYLTVDEIPEGHLPGINSGDTFEEKFKDTDRSRVYYY